MFKWIIFVQENEHVYILALEKGSSFIWELAKFTEYLISGCNLENKSIEYLEVDKRIEYSEAEIMSEYLKLWRVSANIRTSEYPS